MKEVTIKLFNAHSKDNSIKVTLCEDGYVYIAEDDVCIELDPEEVNKLLQLLLNKKGF